MAIPSLLAFWPKKKRIHVFHLFSLTWGGVDREKDTPTLRAFLMKENDHSPVAPFSFPLRRVEDKKKKKRERRALPFTPSAKRAGG